jgi:protein phosphatase 1 regulatory subunit 7
MGDEDDVPLSEELMDLSKIEKTIDGSGFAYTQMDCVGKRVGVIKVIEDYAHLRQINMSKNQIKDATSLCKVPYILSLNVAQNQIKTIEGWEEGSLASLLYLNLAENMLTAMPALAMPALKKVNLAKNEIATCEAFAGHEGIEELDLSSNSLETLAGIGNMPNLKSLSLAKNKIASLEGMAGLPELKSLDLSGNALEDLAGPWVEIPNLSSVNLSGNLLATAKPVEHLRALPKLRSLSVSEECGTGDIKKNPVATEVEQVRLEMLICHWRLDAIDGKDVTDEERTNAQALDKERMEEEARKAAEATEGGDDADA